MQKLFVIVTLLLFCNCEMLCQEIDSLTQLLEVSDSLTSEQKAKINLRLARLYRRTNPADQLRHARISLKEAQTTNVLKSQGLALSEIANHYQLEDNSDSAYYYFEKTIAYFKSDKNIGNVYSRLATLERLRGNYAESIFFHIKADSLFERAGSPIGRVMTNTNLGILLSLQGEYEEAIKYYQKAEAQLDFNNVRAKSQLYHNFAETYKELGDLTQSRKYLEQSIQIKRELNDLDGLANDLTILSMLNIMEGDYDRSIEYLEQSLELYIKMNNKSGQADCYNALGECYRLKGNYGKAEDYLKLAKNFGVETQNHQTLVTNHKEFYELYREQKIWDKALLYLQNYTNLNDSITELEKIKISKELVTKYEIEQILKDKELAESKSALAEQAAEYNRIFAITVASIGALLLAIGLFVFYRFKAKKKEEVLSLKLLESEKHLKLEQQTRISELKALRSQMNPHFMFNALNSIQDLILLKDIRSSNKYLGMFADLLRRVLKSSNVGSISITEEIKTLQLYAELEQLRFGDGLQIAFKNDLSENFSEDFLLPVMLIQPLMENALKHGLLHKKDNKELCIHFYKEASTVVCSIDDNGVGREEAMRIKHKVKSNHLSFSTQAIEERIELLNTGRSQKIKTQIVDKTLNNKSTGTNVLVYFPIQEEYSTN